RMWSWPWRRPIWKWRASNWIRRQRPLKKSRLAGGALGGRGQLGVESDVCLPFGPDDAAKLLCPPQRVVPAGSGCEFGDRVGAHAKKAPAAFGREKGLQPDPGGTQGGGSKDGPGPAL